MLKCGRCKRTHYCSVICQKKDWKNHKRNCFEFKSVDEEDIAEFGSKTFIQYVDMWRRGCALAFGRIAKSFMSENQINSHVFVLFSNYDEDRENSVMQYCGKDIPYPKVQIQSYEAIAVTDLLSRGMDVAFRSVFMNQKPRPDMFVLFHMVTNIKTPNLTPMLRLTNVGTDERKSNLLSIDEYIAQVNSGIVMIEAS